MAEGEASNIRAHLSSCDGCRAMAEEFRTSQLRLRTFAAPEFDADFYEQIRGNVLAEISARPIVRPSIFQIFRPLFAWRPAVAASLALLLVFGALSGLLYQRLSNPGAYLDAVERGGQEINSNQYRETPVPKSTTALNSNAGAGEQVRSSGASARSTVSAQRKLRPGNQATARPEALAPQKNEAASIATLQTATANNRAALGAPSMQAVARMEIQTSDPNIRIIWLGRKASE